MQEDISHGTYTTGMPILFFIGFLLASSLSGQSKLIAFEELERKQNQADSPVYYFEGHPFSGKTYDYHQQENVSIEHHLNAGFLILKESFRAGKKIEYAEFKQGILDGKYLKYFGNGQKYVEHHYREGRMHGMQYGWQKDGTVRFVARYTNGLEMMRLNYPPPGGFDPMIKQ